MPLQTHPPKLAPRQTTPITPRTLVVTMGGQAQVVTFALDWLLARGAQYSQLLVLHVAPRDPRTRSALAQLATEFPGDEYLFAGIPLRFRPVLIQAGTSPLDDISSEADAEATWQFMYQVLSDLKAEGQAIDLVIAGGRRIMGLMAQSAALLLFGHQDRVWHLYTSAELRARAHEGAVRHAAPDEDAHLIQIPFVPWGAYFPGLREMAGAPPARVRETQIRQLDAQERAHCERVMHELTKRQQDVLRSLGLGRTPQETAEELNVTLKTVDTHKTKILDLCRNEWRMPPDARLDYHFVREKFRDMF